MRAELPNADAVLKPGQFVRVTLDGAMRNNALAVPQVAVLDGAQGKFVYVADKDKDGKDIAECPSGHRRTVGFAGQRQPVDHRQRHQAWRQGDH